MMLSNRRLVLTSVAALAAALPAEAQQQGYSPQIDGTGTDDTLPGPGGVVQNPDAPSANAPASQPGAGGPQVVYPSFNPFFPQGVGPVWDDSIDEDNLPGSAPAVTYHGRAGSVAPPAPPQSSLPPFHFVRPGDTLWSISASLLNNPWSWPQLWGQNPQVKDPHWIYPGDQLRVRPQGLTPGEAAGLSGPMTGPAPGPLSLLATPPGLVDNTPLTARETVMLRDLGYIGDPNKDYWGEVVGSREDTKLFAEGNTIYIQIREGVDLRIGQSLSLYEELRDVREIRGARAPEGSVVAYLGTAKVDEWDPTTRVARALITESLNPIERGVRVGPVGRRFDVVPPRAADVTLWATVLTSIYPHIMFGRDQVVFIDKGGKDGLRPGNRLFVVRKGDVWREDLNPAEQMTANYYAEAEGEFRTTPLGGNEEGFPEEVIGELRVLRVNENTAIAAVIASSEEIRPGERALVREGY